jgi:hypothetical protein
MGRFLYFIFMDGPLHFPFPGIDKLKKKEKASKGDPINLQEPVGFPDDNQSFGRTNWQCKELLVWIPKYPKKKIYNELRRYHADWGHPTRKESQLFDGGSCRNFLNSWTDPLFTQRLASTRKTNFLAQEKFFHYRRH